MADPAATAARYLAGKQAVVTALSSGEIAEFVPQALRDASFFSARTVYAEHLSETQADIARLLAGGKGPAEIRAAMKIRLAALGYRPDAADEGGLKDLSSDIRTNLVIAMQEAEARGYAVWRSQQTDAKMTVWPAQELFRAESRKVPRDWRARWNEARADLGEGGTSATYAGGQSGPFCALKHDAIWTHPRVNRFGHPWTPFDFQSGMRLRNVKASDARAMRVLTGRGRPAPRRDPFDTVRSSSAAGVPPDVLAAWVEAFKGRAVVSQGRVWVAPDALRAVRAVAAAAAAGAEAVSPLGFAPGSVLAQAAALLGLQDLPAHTAVRLSAGAIRSGAADVSDAEALVSAALPAVPSAASAEGGELVLRTRASELRLRPAADAPALDVAAYRREQP
jgi:hypothetical protein